ncbi:hypothetical protein, conserved [Eimeria tenella]|uniref:Uncharacterized protein n=1 Tax=Eimeria tenella TaxID=5802 RepID=U6KVV2_EIMTE|nr:hypothetical protein, conserved [Eimeria tenella]CDJ39635.1 hypothetical protein, conserved [Eimeria tenella]|eukprot:XP_013230390.1 hypothetical protein, conserved [Eimeria tenella]
MRFLIFLLLAAISRGPQAAEAGWPGSRRAAAADSVLASSDAATFTPEGSYYLRQASPWEDAPLYSTPGPGGAQWRGESGVGSAAAAAAAAAQAAATAAAAAAPYVHVHAAAAGAAPQQVRPWGSLQRLARALGHPAVLLRAALLRHFCLAVVQLRSPFLGLRSSGAAAHRGSSSSSSSEQQGKEIVGEAEVAALAAKLAGVVGSAGHTAEAGKLWTKLMLLQFERLVSESEKLLFEVARQGNPALMVFALSRIVPPVMKGFSYLESFPSSGVSGVLEPVRVSLLRRARELDLALLAAQNDPFIVHKFSKDITEEELQRERELAALEGGAYAPVQPVFAESFPAGGRGFKQQPQAHLPALLLVCFLLFSIYSSFKPLKSRRKARAEAPEAQEGWNDLEPDAGVRTPGEARAGGAPAAPPPRPEWPRHYPKSAESAIYENEMFEENLGAPEEPRGGLFPREHFLPGLPPSAYAYAPPPYYTHRQPPTVPSAPPIPPGGFVADLRPPPPSYWDVVGLPGPGSSPP